MKRSGSDLGHVGERLLAPSLLHHLHATSSVSASCTWRSQGQVLLDVFDKSSQLVGGLGVEQQGLNPLALPAGG